MSKTRILSAAALAISAFGISGCGSNPQIVKSLSFNTAVEDGDLMAGFSANVGLGSGKLPTITLPIYDPNAPAKTLGTLGLTSAGVVTVKVDVTEAAKVHVKDGTLLPNGGLIPVTLPSGVVPVALPVLNSNSMVYLAVGNHTMMAGVAVTLVADPSSDNSSWLKTLQALPANIFYPFTMSKSLTGSAGVFTGSNVGIGIFAVDTASTPAGATSLASASPSATTLSVRSLAMSANSVTNPAAGESEVFTVHVQVPEKSKLRKIQRALAKVRQTKLN